MDFMSGLGSNDLGGGSETTFSDVQNYAFARRGNSA